MCENEGDGRKWDEHTRRVTGDEARKRKVLRGPLTRKGTYGQVTSLVTIQEPYTMKHDSEKNIQTFGTHVSLVQNVLLILLFFIGTLFRVGPLIRVEVVTSDPFWLVGETLESRE